MDTIYTYTYILSIAVSDRPMSTLPLFLCSLPCAKFFNFEFSTQISPIIGLGRSRRLKYASCRSLQCILTVKGTDGLLNVQKKTEMQRPWALHFAARSAWLAFLGGKRSRGHYHDDIINPIILNSDEGNTPCQFLHHISSSIMLHLHW